MRFENAKHFLHIDSYARVIAIPYGERRINGQSGTPVPTVRLRIADSRGVWREALDGRPHRVAPTVEMRNRVSRTVRRGALERTTDGRPYSGKFRTAVGETCGLPLRKVISIQHGEGRSNGTHTWVRPYSGFVREVTAAPHGGRRTFSDDQWSPLQW